MMLPEMGERDMTRPDYPSCVMTPAIINRIRSDQECYDEDPERWERREAEAEELRVREEYEMRQDQDQDQDQGRQANVLDDNGLDF